MLDLLFGSVEKNAEREYANYKPGKGREKDIGDYIGDFLTGRGSAIDKAVEDYHVEQLNRSYGTTLGELNTPNVAAPTINKNTDPVVLRQQIDVAVPKAQAYKDMMTQAAGKGIIIDTTKITTPDAGYAYINEKLEEKEKAKKAEAEKKAADLRNEGYTREDALTERLNIREDRRDARAALERAETRKDNLEYRRDQMNFEYARLAQTDREKAQDRRDRALMALIQGLGNLGTAFTI